MTEQLINRVEYLPYPHIADLDPLRFDSVMAMLPQLNREQNLEALRNCTAAAVRTAAAMEFTDSEALAAMRDLDFLASSVVRHGENPIETIDGLEGQFLRLGEIAGTIPRGTVFTYAAANPTDERQRTFTGTSEEREFIASVAESIGALDGAVNRLANVTHGDDYQVNFSMAISGSTEAMQQMIRSIVNVRRTVSPEFFTYQMRPYFEPLVIGGKEYTGAGGAQMQLLALDYMLWGCTDETPEYNEFFRENFQYLTPAQQEAVADYLETNGQVSVVDYLSAHPSETPRLTELTLETLATIRKFRYPHRRVAQDNFKLRSGEAVGSGSYRPDILDTLIVKVEDAIWRLENSRTV